jgi:DNA-binding PadR family transcriptional regulator
MRRLGEFEQLILLALLALPEEDRYGVPIRELIENRTGRSVSMGAVYTALDRLTARGLVDSKLGEPTAERGGRRKRIYRLEKVGTRELGRSIRSVAAMSRGLLSKLGVRWAPLDPASGKETQ